MLLVVIEALKNWKMISVLEFIATILGMFGAMVMIVPNWFKRCFGTEEI